MDCHIKVLGDWRSKVTLGGRQKQKYVPQSQVEAARAGIARHKRLLSIGARITQINLIRMRKKALDEE